MSASSKEASNNSSTKEPWVGVDLDGTLAFYNGWKGLNHIGSPVPVMEKRVREWLATGTKVKIVTARACVPEGIPPVAQWLAKHGFPEMDITNAKDFDMIELWDDRCVQVLVNTGRPLVPLQE